MDLDKLQFKANVRSGWQALDLGFLMARQWWRTLFMVSAVPPAILLTLLLVIFSEHPVWAGFIVWWLKPFWERLPLYLASRNIFAQESSESDGFVQMKRLYSQDWLPWLLWRRLSFYRAFDAPVSLLEELKGSARSKRLGVLHGKHTDIALANQLVCFFCEIIVASGLFLGLMFFVPDSIQIEVFDSTEELTLLGDWIFTLCAFAAMVLVMPFHTLAGFALYLNRRIELEAWDIEITFRSLSQRKLQPSNSLIASLLISIAIVLAGNSLSSDAYAAVNHDNTSSKQLIEEVLKDKDFGEEKTVRKWRFRNWIEENEDKIPDWIIELVEWMENNVDFTDTENSTYSTAFWLKVLLVGCFILLLVYLFYRFHGPLSRLGNKKSTAIAPDVMFGLDVRAESLPEDVPAQVMRLWQLGSHRDALGLLYRAALSHLIQHHALAFKSSHTEAECAALVQAYGIKSLSRYFSQLTRLWRRLAYGHQLPEALDLQNLCDNWSKVMTHEPQ